MFERLRSWLLHWLRVPLEPEPPAGDPRSVRMFRASRRLYYLRLIRWGVGQIFALVGILFWLGVLGLSEREAEKLRAGQTDRALKNLKSGQNRITTEPLRAVPRTVFRLLALAEAAGVVIYLSQLVITCVGIRLDYELRWYIVTDRSLRIRSGLWAVQESTMSFANLQQVVVSQGPLQRLLGISDVRVESAGGGRGGSSDQTHSQSMHTGVFHGVENAVQIRDLIVERLRQFRETGLGDPDEAEKQEGMTPASPDVLEAGHELLNQARMLRAAWVENRSRF